MIELIRQNRFKELLEKIETSENSFQIHKFLGDILNNNMIEVHDGSFKVKEYQDEFIEGFKVYTALNKSDFSEDNLKKYTNILVQLSNKIGKYTRVIADTARDIGVHLSDVGNIYKVHPEIRTKFQEYIDLLKEKGDIKSIANIAAAKAQISTSIGNLLSKEEVGNDMLQFADSYANVGQTEMAIKIYKGILYDFESESIKNSSGLFPEIAQVDTRSEAEIEIFEKAIIQYEKLTGEKIPEIKRVHVNTNEQAKKLAKEVLKKEREIFSEQGSKKKSFFDRLKGRFINN